jgi:D-glycero-alpha-D-manno-heptose-7-phosphate kinase
MPSSVKQVLQRCPVNASAPCRVDSGGTWDIKAMALPLEGIEPVTINIALSLRSRVTISPFKEGWVKISSDGFVHDESYPVASVPFRPPFGLFFAAISHFGFHGLELRIQSDSPVKAALGGSSTALVALLKALSRLRGLLGQKTLSRREILHLGYHLEDGVSLGACGIQDQAAAAYGGVSLWRWHYGNTRIPYEREALMDVSGQKEMSKRFLLAYSGRSHVSLRTNRSWLNDFLSGKTRTGWVEVNEIVKALAQALKESAWGKAARLLREEMALRRKITPDALIPVTQELVKQAEKLGCGARFAGAGAGGSVWAVGNLERIESLRRWWEATLKPLKGASLLPCHIESGGVR